MDLILVVRESDQPFVRRAARWDVTNLPVPVDLLVYTEDEWERMTEAGRFPAARGGHEVVWIWERSG